jgi:hypothetical protein
VPVFGHDVVDGAEQVGRDLEVDAADLVDRILERLHARLGAGVHARHVDVEPDGHRSLLHVEGDLGLR